MITISKTTTRKHTLNEPTLRLVSKNKNLGAVRKALRRLVYSIPYTYGNAALPCKLEGGQQVEGKGSGHLDSSCLYQVVDCSRPSRGVRAKTRQKKATITASAIPSNAASLATWDNTFRARTALCKKLECAVLLVLLRTQRKRRRIPRTHHVFSSR